MNKLLLLGVAALTIASSHASTVYMTSSQGEPWGQTDFTDAMTTVFGSYTTADYETSNAALFNASTAFVFMEGSAANDAVLQAYLTLYSPIIFNWVQNGGRLMINSSGWDNSIVTGIGNIVLNSGDVSVSGNAAGPNSPFFQGPYGSVSPSMSGLFFANDSVTGPGLTNVITGDTGAASVAFEQFGAGMVLFSGAASPEFQNPQPDSYTLLNNELAFAAGALAQSGSTPLGSGAAPEPGTVLLMGAGLIAAGIAGRRGRGKAGR